MVLWSLKGLSKKQMSFLPDERGMCLLKGLAEHCANGSGRESRSRGITQVSQGAALGGSPGF